MRRADTDAKRRVQSLDAKRSAMLSGNLDGPDVGQLVDALEGAAQLARGPDRPLPRPLVAVRNLHEVERLSREGRTVPEIAFELGLSRSYVTELRRTAGLGRNRCPL